MRIYVPATLPLLAEWRAAGWVPASAERYQASAEDEESEYAALVAAAADAAALLEEAGRRVVVVADVEDPDADVEFRRVAAVHADVEDRPVDADPDEDLGWFAVQELDDLLR